MKRKKKTHKPSKVPEKRIAQNMKKILLQFMGGRRYQPMLQQELFEKLHIPPALESLCAHILTDLIAQGEVQVQKKRLSLPQPVEEVMIGTMRMHPKGFGFVVPENPVICPQDVFIPKHLTDNAVDGDRVEIAITPTPPSTKGPEGKVLSVLKRARSHLAGTIYEITPQGVLLIHVPLLGSAKSVIAHPSEGITAHIGDRVILKVLQWGNEKESTRCEMTHVIGNISDPSIDVQAATEEFDITSSFPKRVEEHAKKYGNTVKPSELKQRTDLTKTTALTIDPDTAKDFDDALSIRVDKKGNYTLSVHIADVAHYVKPNTPLDQEAYSRGNSTYFPGTCVPMLPEALSNELCSLKPNVIRLTVSIVMRFDPTGTLLNYKILRSFIKSAKRFTYCEAKEVLDGKKRSRYTSTLQKLVALCERLKAKRKERGSIDFSLPELVVCVDSKGMPQHMQRVEYDITHQLVEECMLKANEIVALELTRRGKGAIYRVHEAPHTENFEEFLLFARTLGFTVPLSPSVQELQHLFEEAKKTPYFLQLTVGFIRSMKLAQYSAENVGHFGLKLEHYCHFTSPIRRYSDLIVQRLLFDEEPEGIDLEKIATHCSDQERISFRAETSVKTLKKLRLLQKDIEEDRDKIFHATITKIKPFGLYFELHEMLFEGFIHISELGNDFFIFDEKRALLQGRRSGKMYRLGKEITVLLKEVDLILLQAYWELYPPKPHRKRNDS